MSTLTDASAPSSSNHNNFSLLSICSKVALDGTIYNDWVHNIKMSLWFENKEYVFEKELIEIDEEKATPKELASYKKHYNDATKVVCITVTNMTHELQRLYEDYWLYELMEKFCKWAHQEKYKVVKALMEYKMKEGEIVCSHV